MSPDLPDPRNPYSMDEDCQNCPALVESRTQVVHGYGDPTADIAVLGTAPTASADRTGIPFTGDETGEVIQALLGDLGLSDSPPDSTEPALSEVYLTYVTRCHHPERGATDEERHNCEGYRTAELRRINPELIVAVGQGALDALAFEYTTRSADDLDVTVEHATTIQGRGFEILPMIEPADASESQLATFREHVADELDRDYRQTKGQRRK
ncbi:DNA polymerase bacteriophage-type protein [Halorhabdus tiamatea SARL4B]|uniref:DNA polymerase bacteriophage-type protein n=1 Tax=Halorhabdus tiamatea SARL4B TaxID=1033806 RepID=F7PHX2_9EURY|nr:uracil-DNA glycosylase family protein [Halorhabdus tiamatea]ERJ06966.1 DNA polymerase bacteriophage-type protein [Halorhabdus tiamatea SARL4B]CCQ32333.1 uracil DNA glycosylase superfamily protein [Halorhabdus tiamatea SARL4B]